VKEIGVCPYRAVARGRGAAHKDLQRALYVAFGAPRKAPVVEGGGKVRLEPDRLVVKAQPFINVDSSNPSLEPLLGS
jgi:hypothetical protein